MKKYASSVPLQNESFYVLQFNKILATTLKGIKK